MRRLRPRHARAILTSIGETDVDPIVVRLDLHTAVVAAQDRPAIGGESLQQRHRRGRRDDAGVGLVQHLGVGVDLPSRPAAIITSAAVNSSKSMSHACIESRYVLLSITAP